MRQVLCVWFPNWSLQRLCHARPELKSRTVVLYCEAVRGGFQVAACSESAAARGVQPGMPLAEAKGRSQESEFRIQKSEARSRKIRGKSLQPERSVSHSDLRFPPPDSWILNSEFSFFPHSPRADLVVLKRMAASGRCFSPLVGIEEAAEPECVLFDLTGCAHLFGGEQALAEQVVREWQAQGFVVRAAVAPTIGAAWGMAKYGREERIQNSESRSQEFEGGKRKAENSGQEENQNVHAAVPSCRPSEFWIRNSEFSLLPLAALRLSPATIETLRELDIHRIEQLLALPCASLAARFGAEVARRIDQATGQCEELITPLHVPEPIEAACTFEEPHSDRETLCAAIRGLLDEITRQLEARQQGIRGLLVRLSLGLQTVTSFTLGLMDPRSTAASLYELAVLRLERLALSAPVDSLLLRAATSARLPQRQPSLLDQATDHARERQLIVWLERLWSRLGDEAIVRPHLQPDAQPELAWRGERSQESEVRSQETGGGRRKAASDCHRGNQNVGAAVPSCRSSGFWILGSEFSLPTSDFSFSARPLQLESAPRPIQVVAIAPEGPPVHFTWQGQEHRVDRVWGPERITTGWWREVPADRDYYRVETSRGQQFWLFRNRQDGGWFLQGEFG